MENKKYLFLETITSSINKEFYSLYGYRRSFILLHDIHNNLLQACHGLHFRLFIENENWYVERMVALKGFKMNSQLRGDRVNMVAILDSVKMRKTSIISILLNLIVNPCQICSTITVD